MVLSLSRPGHPWSQAAYEKIRAGASLVEVYTGLVYKGPGRMGLPMGMGWIHGDTEFSGG